MYVEKTVKQYFACLRFTAEGDSLGTFIDEPERVFPDGSWYNLLTTDDFDFSGIITCYFGVGIKNNEKCILYTDSTDTESLLKGFLKLGIDIGQVIKSGQFDIVYDDGSAKQDFSTSLCVFCSRYLEKGYKGLRIASCSSHSEILKCLAEKKKEAAKNSTVSYMNCINIDRIDADSLFGIIDEIPDFIFVYGGKVYVYNETLGFFYEDGEETNRSIILQMFMKQQRFRNENKILELLSGVAHEFNNLLTPILGFAQIIKQRVDSPDLKMYVEMIEDSAKDGAAIVKRIQKFTQREDETSRSKCNINEIITCAISMAQPRWKNEENALGKNITIKTELNSSGYVFVNISEIREVIINVLFNAIDAIESIGEITIKSYDKGDKVFFSVKDNGIGMSEDVRCNLFTPFFTTKKERGTGMGLPIVYNILHEHGGAINVYSKPGEGTDTVMWLPGESS